jgi:hypothetical protein
MLRALMSLCTAKAPSAQAAVDLCTTCATSLLENAHITLKQFIFPVIIFGHSTEIVFSFNV